MFFANNLLGLVNGVVDVCLGIVDINKYVEYIVFSLGLGFGQVGVDLGLILVLGKVRCVRYSSEQRVAGPLWSCCCWC